MTQRMILEWPHSPSLGLARWEPASLEHQFVCFDDRTVEAYRVAGVAVG